MIIIKKQTSRAVYMIFISVHSDSESEVGMAYAFDGTLNLK